MEENKLYIDIRKDIISLIYEKHVDISLLSSYLGIKKDEFLRNLYSGIKFARELGGLRWVL